jgi:hypothetical protein
MIELRLRLVRGMPGSAEFRLAGAEYVDHYHAERNHQGSGNRLICRKATASSTNRNGTGPGLTIDVSRSIPSGWSFTAC